MPPFAAARAAARAATRSATSAYAFSAKSGSSGGLSTFVWGFSFSM